MDGNKFKHARLNLKTPISFDTKITFLGLSKNEDKELTEYWNCNILHKFNFCLMKHPVYRVTCLKNIVYLGEIFLKVSMVELSISEISFPIDKQQRGNAVSPVCRPTHSRLPGILWSFSVREKAVSAKVEGQVQSMHSGGDRATFCASFAILKSGRGWL